jgi:hypothetical protein
MRIPLEPPSGRQVKNSGAPAQGKITEFFDGSLSPRRFAAFLGGGGIQLPLSA